MLTPPRKLSWRERLSGVMTPLAPRAGFLRDLATPFFFSWRPPLREPMDEYARSYHEVTTRATDVIQNSGFLAGGVEQATTQIVGSGLALNAKPFPDVFGNDADASTWARDVERRFEAWARDPYHCDLAERMSLGQMCFAATRMWFGMGEILALVQYAPKPNQTIGTKIQLLPPTRCPEVSRSPDAILGVILDRYGTPLRYCINTPLEANQPLTMREIEVPVRDVTGRLIVIHVHDSPPTVVRGITPLAPAMLVTRQYDQLANATLTAALIQSLFAATIESDAGNTNNLLEALQGEEEQGSTFDTYMSARREWYEAGGKFDLGTFGKIVHLFVGEKLNFLRSEHPNQNYKAFARQLLLEISKCLGITYEQLTGDREGATYSSERMGSAENWLLTTYRRTQIAGRFMQACYEAWLEESIDIGETPFPGGLDAFVAQRPLVCRADWRGPPKPSADDYKTAQANNVKFQAKVITREQWCADEGTDWEEVAEQEARERDRREELGLDTIMGTDGKPMKIGPDNKVIPPTPEPGSPEDDKIAKSDGEK